MEKFFEMAEGTVVFQSKGLSNLEWAEIVQNDYGRGYEYSHKDDYALYFKDLSGENELRLYTHDVLETIEFYTTYGNQLGTSQDPRGYPEFIAITHRIDKREVKDVTGTWHFQGDLTDGLEAYQDNCMKLDMIKENSYNLENIIKEAIQERFFQDSYLRNTVECTQQTEDTLHFQSYWHDFKVNVAGDFSSRNNSGFEVTARHRYRGEGWESAGEFDRQDIFHRVLEQENLVEFFQLQEEVKKNKKRIQEMER